MLKIKYKQIKCIYNYMYLDLYDIISKIYIENERN